MTRYKLNVALSLILLGVFLFLTVQGIRMVQASTTRVSRINEDIKREMPDTARYLDRWLVCYRSVSSAKEVQQCDIAIQLAAKSTGQEDRVAVALERQRDKVWSTNSRSNVGWPFTLIYEN